MNGAKETAVVRMNGLKGILALTALLYSLRAGQHFAGSLAGYSLMVLWGYQLVSIVERQSIGEWRQWRTKWLQHWWVLLWGIGLMTIVWLFSDYSYLVQERTDLLTSLLGVSNWYHWITGQGLVNAGNVTGLGHLAYISWLVQASLLLTGVSYLLHRTQLENRMKLMVWLLLGSLTSVVSALLPMTSAVEALTYMQSFMAGAILVYAVPLVLNFFYRYAYKQLAYQLIGLLSAVGLVFVLTSLSVQTVTDLFSLVPLVNLLTIGSLFGVIVGVPALVYLTQFPLFTALGERLFFYYLVYCGVSIWANSWTPLVLWGVGFVLAEACYWLFIRRIVALGFINTVDLSVEFEQMEVAYQQRTLSPMMWGSLAVTILLLIGLLCSFMVAYWIG